MFFPIRDDNPTRNPPVLSWVLIGLCVLVFLWQASLGEKTEQAFFAYGFIPARFFAGEGWGTIFTSMFMHGGFWHLAGNMLYLWIFGDNVEDSIGSRPRFVAFYLLCGVAAALAQAYANPASLTPMVGASGAIAGLLGAYLILHPRANVQCLIFFFVVNIPAFFVLGAWLVLQFVNLGQVSAEGGGVAYFAHIGGMVLIPFFKRKEIALLDKPRSVAFSTHTLHVPSIPRKSEKPRHHPWDE